ncbi:glycoside hydrolase family 15 protein [Haloarchaeobius amylolyticus]|uniref:glycoside hydrolase family 15 protein n=1 Tax=Haloarchaeobius amylolyticus TaxID=1198296 RepID=UPI002271ED9B|nr:glycoside hydrolase family 15 protein [Haloarchaeobius amylolyticus]
MRIQQGRRIDGERPTTDGLFSGGDGRLVFVERDGSIRDYSYPLSGLYGLDDSRFGVWSADEVAWLDEVETVRQEYYRDTTLVVTEHEADDWTARQYDLTLSGAHVTHVELRGSVPDDAHLVSSLSFVPDGSVQPGGKLAHENAVEVYHDREHDYVTASTGLDNGTGESDLGKFAVGGWDPLGDTVRVAAPFDSEGELAHTTLVTLLTDRTETDRQDALAHLRAVADHHPTDKSLRAVAESQRHGLSGMPHRDAIATDLRTLGLLRAPSGALMKAPEYDPFTESSGGYGYTWFRDHAVVGDALLGVDSSFDLGEAAPDHAAAVRFLCETQLEDGTWPQRVWPKDGALAPGWANGNLESDGEAYQPDQGARAITYLARYLRAHDPSAADRGMAEEAIARGLDGLDATFRGEELGRYQSVWENEGGRFVHGVATALEAYATAALAPVSDDLTERAHEGAHDLVELLDGFWDEEAGVFARRLDADGEPVHDRFDVATLAVASAYRSYARLDHGSEAELSSAQVARLDSHVQSTLDALEQSVGDAVGLARYERDNWRGEGDGDPKVWSVATAWGVVGAAELAALLDEYDPDPDAGEVGQLVERAKGLLEPLLPGGELVSEHGYLAEQSFADGSQDSATPLAWAHGLRLAGIVELDQLGALGAETAAPTGPDEQPTWTTGEKYGIGTVPDHEDPESHVWFTLTEGALTEPRFPRVDLMNVKTLDFLVVDSEGGYAARTHNEHRTDDDAETLSRHTEMVGTDALVYRQTITEDDDDHEWELSVEYVTDPEGDAIVGDVSFSARDDNQYDVYAVADSACSNSGAHDRAAVVGDESEYALTSVDDTPEYLDNAIVDPDGEEYEVAVALASSRSFDVATVGTPDAAHVADLFRGDATAIDHAADAAHGNVVLLGRLGSGVSSVADTLALGFATEGDEDAALTAAGDALDGGFVSVRDGYVNAWQEFVADVSLPNSVQGSSHLANLYRASVMVLKAVEDKTFRGAGIASPSVPWGDAVPADEPTDFGYNFSWARDLYQVFTALETVGKVEEAADSLAYIYNYQQRENGFLPQNTYLDGRTRWGGEQLDNIAFPSVMAYQLWERHGITFEEADYDYEQVRASAAYVVRSGPHSGQERWEEEAGYSPSTIAAEIAGLACAAWLADAEGETADAIDFLAHADAYRRGVERWCATTTGTNRIDNTPYYVRVTRNGEPDSGTRRELANHGPTLDERAIVDAGFLDLVRLGILPWDDPVVENSVEVVDETIRVDTPHGPAWYRYNGDGYGEVGEREPDEGAPWGLDRLGQGRLWPIFTGERGEYELRRGTASGDLAPQNLLETMAGFANSGRMIPEQVWDREYETEYGWEFGEGTGAATPLAWSMAQYIRLADSIDAGEPIETPRFIAERYIGSNAAPVPPALSVEEVAVDEATETVAVSGKTNAASVLVKTGADRTLVPVDDGEYAVELDCVPHQGDVTVIGATGEENLASVGTVMLTRNLQTETRTVHGDD